MFVRRVQDPVHGLMEFRGMEAALVEMASAPEIQRLRQIRQLGLTHLVFPGAEHSRFAHSLGAAHLAIRFARQVRRVSRQLLSKSVQPQADDIRDLGLAALCHDIGHGPLSHMWEREVIREEFDRSAWKQALGLTGKQGLDGLKWHELTTQALLAWPEGDLHNRLERYESGLSDRIGGLLAGQHWLPYLPRLLNGDIDVDRCDFVARDAMFSGVAYGRYDLEWLMSTITLGFDHSEPVVGFDRRKAVRVLEQFLIARRALYDTVYQHRTVRAAEGMFGLFLKRLKHLTRNESLPPFSNRGLIRPIVRLFQTGTLQPEELLALDDSTLWVLVRDVAAHPRGDKALSELARRLLNRDLFKGVAVEPETVGQLKRKESKRRSDVEDIIRKVTGHTEPEYFFYLDELKLDLLAESGEPTGRYGSALLVDTGRSDRPVTLARNQDPFRAYRKETTDGFSSHGTLLMRSSSS